VWGVAYRIKDCEIQNVKEYLDIREINGYTAHRVQVHQGDPYLPKIVAIAYIGAPSNPQFVGNPPPSVNELARHIYHSCGPSGENREYLYLLYQSLIELCPDNKDNHVYDLRCRVALIEESEETVSFQEIDIHAVVQTHTEGQEEVERVRIDYSI